MFQEIVRLELKNHLKNPMIYVLTLLITLLVFGAISTDTINIGNSVANINKNAPFLIARITAILNIFSAIIVTSVLNLTAQRDFKCNMHEMLFSTGLPKGPYLFGRFLPSVFIATLPISGVFLATIAATLNPWADQSMYGPIPWKAFGEIYLYIILPTTLFLGSVVFILGIKFRNTLISFSAVLAVMILYFVSLSFDSRLENEVVLFLLDPFGLSSYSNLTEYWTVAEKETYAFTDDDQFYIGRAFWAGLGFLILITTFVLFDFSKTDLVHSRKKHKAVSIPSLFDGLMQLPPIPRIRPAFTNKTYWYQYANQTKIEFLGIANGIPFVLILALTLLNCLPNLIQADQWASSTVNYPVTFTIIRIIRSTFIPFIYFLTVYLVGYVIFREREAKMSEFFNAYAFPNWVMLAGKISGLFAILTITLFIPLFVGVLTQLFNGYYTIQLSYYFTELFVITLLDFYLIIALSATILVITNNQLLGYLLVTTFLFGNSLIVTEVFGLNQNALSYGEVPGYYFSDYNHLKPFSISLFWYYSYWTLFATLLLTVCALFWVRSKDTQFVVRLKMAISRLRRARKLIFGTLLLLFLGNGIWIYYNTQVLNSIENPDEVVDSRISYEKQFSGYLTLPQPRITSIQIKADIYPDERSFHSKATITLKNATDQRIDSLFLSWEHSTIQKSVIGAGRQRTEHPLFSVYALDQPLYSGDSLKIEVITSYLAKGFENELSLWKVTEGFTILTNEELLPAIGYNPKLEVEDQSIRTLHFPDTLSKEQKTELPASTLPIEVSVQATTHASHTVLSAGELVSHNKSNGRSNFTYQGTIYPDQQIAIISAPFNSKMLTKEDRKISIYFLPDHAANTDQLLIYAQEALQYFEEHYQDTLKSEIRLVEFPRYLNLEQTFNGVIPLSEQGSFVEDLTDPEASHLARLTIAEHIAKLWWATQLNGSNTVQTSFVKNSLPGYHTLMVYNRHEKPNQYRKALKSKQERYLQNRGAGKTKEQPLTSDDNLQSVSELKGSIVLSALANYLGEKTVNRLLKEFYIDSTHSTGTQIGLVRFLQENTADSLDYFIKESLDELVMYDNRVVTAEYDKLSDGSFRTILKVRSGKFSLDSSQSEIQLPMSDAIQLGLFVEDNLGKDSVVALSTKILHGGDTIFQLYSTELPVKAGIDPGFFLLDRMPGDNIKVVKPSSRMLRNRSLEM